MITYKELLKSHGRKFKAIISGTPCEGEIEVQGDSIFLCQNEVVGVDGHTNNYYKHSWVILSDIPDSVTDFEFLPKTGQPLVHEIPFTKKVSVRKSDLASYFGVEEENLIIT